MESPILFQSGRRAFWKKTAANLQTGENLAAPGWKNRQLIHTIA